MIEIEGVGKSFNGLTAVDDITMTINAHEFVTIVGMSGSGKTTLLRMINRLVELDRGTIRIDGVDNRNVPGPELRRSMGYVIQQHGLFPHRTVAENIATVPRLLGWDRRRIKARVDELLLLFQLEPEVYGPRYPHELSGGQQQRVGVARALAARPNILLMDEPFGALDPIIRNKAREDLLAIQRRLGTTIVMVTHDMEEALALGNRIAVMDAGKLIQYADPAEVLRYPASAFVESLVGKAERPFRLLSFSRVADIMEAGPAEGPAVCSDLSLRDALAEMLWHGASSLPVADGNGNVLGRITLEALTRNVAGPG